MDGMVYLCLEASGGQNRCMHGASPLTSLGSSSDVNWTCRLNLWLDSIGPKVPEVLSTVMDYLAKGIIVPGPGGVSTAIAPMPSCVALLFLCSVVACQCKQSIQGMHLNLRIISVLRACD